MPEAITVLLADDHALVRRAFRRMLEDEAGIIVVGEAGDGIEAVQQAHLLKPRVVLMDCGMPGSDGLSATREIVKTLPEISVVVLSMYAEEAWVRKAVDAGARGYVLKTAMDLNLASAIKRVVAGELLFDPQSAEPPASRRKSDLSPREREVLQLIVDGKSTKEIALQLGLSENTVGVHRANLMSTLGVRKTAELVVLAIQNGLITLT